jgi:hypothetical protein
MTKKRANEQPESEPELTPAQLLEQANWHYNTEVYEAVHDLLLKLFKVIEGVETHEAVSGFREVSRMLHDQAEDVDGWALCLIHGLELTDENRDEMVAQHPDTQAAVDAFLHPDWPQPRRGGWQRIDDKEQSEERDEPTPEEMVSLIEADASWFEDAIEAGPAIARAILEGKDPRGLPLLVKIYHAFEAGLNAIGQDREVGMLWIDERDRVDSEARARHLAAQKDAVLEAEDEVPEDEEPRE